MLLLTLLADADHPRPRPLRHPGPAQGTLACRTMNTERLPLADPEEPAGLLRFKVGIRRGEAVLRPALGARAAP